MTPKDYILEKLERLKAPAAAKEALPPEGLAAFIIEAVLSKKFRKYSITGAFQSHLHRAVALNIQRNEPIKFAWPFGAYKLWRLEEAPEADWAELFSLIYFSNWVRPIAEHYGPGVWFDFSSDEVIVEKMNNIPQSDTQAYARSFLGLIDFMEKFLPKNVRFTLTPVRSRYTPEEFEAEFAEKMGKMQKERNGQWPEVSEADKRTIELNVKLNPGQDSDSLWREKNKAIHDSYAAMSKRRPYFRAEDKIMVTATSFPNTITVGTTKTSVAKFWVGSGVLRRRDDSFIEHILSPAQLQKTQCEWQPLSIDGLKGKNFTKIRIVQ